MKWFVAAFFLFGIGAAIYSYLDPARETAPKRAAVPPPAAGSGRAPELAQAPRPEPQDGPPAGLPSDYFPMKLGTVWTYKVVFGPATPYSFGEATWPIGRDRAVRYMHRGLLLGGAAKADKPQATLSLAVAAPVFKQATLPFPLTAELKVLKDDAHIFGDAKQLFISLLQSNEYMAMLVETHDSSHGPPGAGGSWGGWGGDDGYSYRFVFYAGRPMTAKSIGESQEKLAFLGSETMPGQAQPMLHFRRVVQAAKKSDAKSSPEIEFDREFNEDMWYAKGKGLVRLTQTHPGGLAMTWTLED